ncbi:MAG: right-handed parallel beta-helix repeat-containing protein, partial [Deltaproteobacteria bacterium]|nr:right-handed parallel beta-helix repeat-containing protein [Deltaproteobacteria bacterium]
MHRFLKKVAHAPKTRDFLRLLGPAALLLAEKFHLVRLQKTPRGARAYSIGTLAAICLMAFLPLPNSFAATEVCGSIAADTIWTSMDSPYIVTCDVSVDKDVTLRINPGVEVRFDGPYVLTVSGTLIARGTSTEKILFTSNRAEENWGYILFYGSSTPAAYIEGNYDSGCILEYCTIEYAGAPVPDNNGAVIIDKASPLINFCTIKNNVTSGIYADLFNNTLKLTNNTIEENSSFTGGGGIFIRNGSVTIANNIIEKNNAYHGGGIYLYESSATITSNNITNNTSSSQGAGIEAFNSDANIINNIIKNNNTTYLNSKGGGISTNSGTVTISKNYILNNSSYTGGGIFAWGGVITISQNIISTNTATTNGGGLYGANAELVISHNSIIYNSSYLQGSALYLGSNDEASVFNNTITGNYQDDLQANSSIFTATSSFSFNNNNIFNNETAYELWNNLSSGSADLDCTGNWWGTATGSEISDKIYDGNDDSSKGLVDYTPWQTVMRIDTPISPPNQVVAIKRTNTIEVEWADNPESDVAGYMVHWGPAEVYPLTSTVDVGNANSYIISGLSPGSGYQVSVTAYDHDYDPSLEDSTTPVLENQTGGAESGYARANWSEETKLLLIRKRTRGFKMHIYKPPLTVGGDIGWKPVAKDNWIGTDITAVAPVQFDADPEDELVIVRRHSSGVYSFDIRDLPTSEDGNTGPPLATDENIGMNVVGIACGNYDDDPQSEIAVVRKHADGTYGVEIYDLPTEVRGNTGPPIASDNNIGINIAAVTGAKYGDYSDDMLLVIRKNANGNHKLHIFAIPETVDDNVGRPVASDESLVKVPVIAVAAGNYDLDRNDELVLVKQRNNGVFKLQIFNLPTIVDGNTGPNIASDNNIPDDVVAVAVVSVNIVPTVTITSPPDGSTFAGGSDILFEGYANDAEDGALSGGALVWTSDMDGQIGTGTSFSRTLARGIHNITLTATDSEGKSATDSVSITVLNAPPVATDDVAATDEDTAVTIDVLGNDSDIDADTLTIDSVTQG